MTMTRLELGGIVFEVVQKDIRNVHLSVNPPDGRVRIAAPLRMTPDTIRVFAISRLGWVRQQRAKLLGQEREPPREFLERESHYVWGRRYLLRLVEADTAPTIDLSPGAMVMSLRPGANEARKHAILEDWYRDQIKKAVPPLIAKWAPRLGVKVERFFVQRMKTKWGSCNPASHTIRLNTELARKPPTCLEYIVVHEMAHLIARRHDGRFQEVLGAALPTWRQIRRVLNGAPLAEPRDPLADRARRRPSPSAN